MTPIEKFQSQQGLSLLGYLNGDLAESADRFIFDQAPLMVYWEATKACDLACVHCRAEAIPYRDPQELRTSEVQALFREIRKFAGERPPHVVITGGDPLRRPDLFDLLSYGRGLGLPISVTPAGTKRLTSQVIKHLKEAGVSGLALSLDGSNASKHDTFRGVPGSFQYTLDAARFAIAEEVPLQINTMVTAETLDDLPHIYETVKELRIDRWALFFLIPAGRGHFLSGITPEQSERLLNWLCALEWTSASDISVKTTEAPHFRRVALQRTRAWGMDEEEILNTPVGRGFGVRDGNGVVFISHIGQVYPSGFLPLAAGNVRRESLVETYRDSGLFCALRDVNRLKGKCGCCPFRAICGGSRARACAVLGDPLESDPLCVYQPRAS